MRDGLHPSGRGCEVLTKVINDEIKLSEKLKDEELVK
jgi:hypothetical protein